MISFVSTCYCIREGEKKNIKKRPSDHPHAHPRGSWSSPEQPTWVLKNGASPRPSVSQRFWKQPLRRLVEVSTYLTQAPGTFDPDYPAGTQHGPLHHSPFWIDGCFCSTYGGLFVGCRHFNGIGSCLVQNPESHGSKGEKFGPIDRQSSPWCSDEKNLPEKWSDRNNWRVPFLSWMMKRDPLEKWIRWLIPFIVYNVYNLRYWF